MKIMDENSQDTSGKLITIDSNGRITLPSDIRKELGWKEGDQVMVIREGEKIVVYAVEIKLKGKNTAK